MISSAKLQFYKEERLVFNKELGCEIPEDWGVVKLGKVVEVWDKYRIPVKEQDRKPGPYPYCGANGIIDYVDGYTHDGEFVLLAEDGGYFGPFEKSAYIMRGKFWANNHVHILKAIANKMTSEFLMFYLNFMDLRPFLTGSTRPKLTQTDMLRIPLPKPSLPEQKAIAEILSTVDRAIEKTDEIIAKVERLKKGLMQELLAGRVRVKVENGKIRFYRETRFKDSEIGKVPEDWEVVKLGKVAEQRKEIVDPTEVDPVTPYVGLEHVNSGETKLSNFGKAEEVVSSKYRFYIRDILYGKLRPYLDKAVISNINGVCSTDFIVMRTKRDYTIPDFLIYVLHTKRFIDYSTAGMTGTNHPRTSWNWIAKFEFPLPPLQEQKAIAEILSTLDKKLELEKKEKERLERIKKGLMNVLLTGRVRVKVG
ncbi:restriction modification system DNA specificity domain protein [Ferroglobus placidus DSM 10642]|uniref:Restriction modification system DNA specificity domain protein n=1 Tax=Ferroglobus placidus (strain DSM 10642 / AEDII12DO) TaxID=589924 RepID=D3S0T0_FERPA|nr:restriction endonuclease subunit S [Ferroglobus placidus]ADC66321.1 restriction modification system DNA specificity domain protein [Ferroglobus placidus DSM 10642]